MINIESALSLELSTVHDAGVFKLLIAPATIPLFVGLDNYGY